MATLAVNDQENVLRNLQAGGAGKSLNAGLKAFNAKTPANKAPKTPFKIPLNDENAVNKPGKSGLQNNGKGNENLLMTSKKGGKIDANAFMTPAGPRNRAPLGMKTTNAKSQAFKTPAPFSSIKTQKASPRMRRPKVKVHQPELEAESENDVPEVEYMPPKAIPLQDDMDDYLPKDWNFPKMDDASMVRGIWTAFHNPIEEDGRTRKQREFEEEVQRDRKERDEKLDKMLAAEMAKDEAEIRRYMGVEDPKKAAPKSAITRAVPKKALGTGVSTLTAKSAAAALSPTPKRNFTAPPAAVKSRVPTGGIFSRKPAKPLADSIPSSRQAAAVAASKSTIGYAQGRAGRTGLTSRKPLANITKPAPFSTTTRRPTSTTPAQPAPHTSSIRSRSAFSRSSSTATDATLVAPQEEETYETAEDAAREMEFLVLSRETDGDDEAWMNGFNAQLQGEELGEELEEFQFTVPEGLRDD